MYGAKCSIDGGAGWDKLDFTRDGSKLSFFLDTRLAATADGVTLADGTVIRNVEQITSFGGGDGDDTFIVALHTGSTFFWDGGGGASRNAGNPPFVDDHDLLVVDASAMTDSIHAYMDTGFMQSFHPDAYIVYGFGSAQDISSVKVTGGSSDDQIDGLSHDDVLNGGPGADTLAGGLGDDSYYVDNANDVVTENSNAGTDTVFSSVTYSIATSYVENVTLTGSLFLSATGNGMDNVLTGNSGNNILNGSVGTDTMIGGAGSDYYYVDSAGDTVTENAGEGIDMVYALISYSLGANLDNLTLLGTANLDGNGNELNNFLFGTSGNNSLNAGAGADYIFALGGNDLLDGGTGADGMYGGSGNDTYMVDNYADLCNEQSKGVGDDDGGIDIVISSANYQLSGFIENLTLTGAAVVGAGNASNNIILGNASGNYLFGLEGTDTLNGGGGADALYGGTGADTFVFDANSGFDVIGDFSTVDGDTIDLHAYSNGVANGAGIVLSSYAGGVYVNMNGGNVIFVANASVSDVSSHIVW